MPEADHVCGGASCGGWFAVSASVIIAPLWPSLGGTRLDRRHVVAEKRDATVELRRAAVRKVSLVVDRRITANIVSSQQSSMPWYRQKQQQKTCHREPTQGHNQMPQARKARSTPAGLTSYPHRFHLTRGS
jgi:hypothetical protein